MIERTFIEHGMKKIQLEQFLKKQLNRAGFTGLHMVKTPLVTRIVLRVARPGLAIGKGGQNIRQLTEDIGKQFGIDNPQIEIQDIQKPELDARATVDKMVELVERGFSWKSIAFRTVRNIKEAGAQGVELVLKGKLSGKGGRKRKHRVVQGYMKKVGNQIKLVDTAKASAYPKAGAIGIKLSIIRPEVVFPDKVNIGEEIDKKEAALASQEKPAEEKKLAAEKPAGLAEREKKPAGEKEEKPAGKRELAEKGKVAAKKEEPAKKEFEKKKPGKKPVGRKKEAAEKKPGRKEAGDKKPAERKKEEGKAKKRPVEKGKDRPRKGKAERKVAG